MIKVFGKREKEKEKEKDKEPKDRLIMSSRFHCGWCLNLISVPAIGLGHYDPLSSHEIDGVRKEKERLTAVSLFSIFVSWRLTLVNSLDRSVCET